MLQLRAIFVQTLRFSGTQRIFDPAPWLPMAMAPFQMQQTFNRGNGVKLVFIPSPGRPKYVDGFREAAVMDFNRDYPNNSNRFSIVYGNWYLLDREVSALSRSKYGRHISALPDLVQSNRSCWSAARASPRRVMEPAHMALMELLVPWRSADIFARHGAIRHHRSVLILLHEARSRALHRLVKLIGGPLKYFREVIEVKPASSREEILTGCSRLSSGRRTMRGTTLSPRADHRGLTVSSTRILTFPREGPACFSETKRQQILEESNSLMSSSKHFASLSCNMQR